jgi:hypothetical protein
MKQHKVHNLLTHRQRQALDGTLNRDLASDGSTSHSIPRHWPAGRCDIAFLISTRPASKGPIWGSRLTEVFVGCIVDTVESRPSHRQGRGRYECEGSHPKGPIDEENNRTN